MNNFLDQLADDEVPVMPTAIDRGLHQRINNNLFGQQVVEVICCAIPYVFSHYLQAIAGAGCFTLSGQYPADTPTEDRDPEPGEDHASRPAHPSE